MDSDIGGILENLWGGDAQKNSLFCVRFRTLKKLFFCAGYWIIKRIVRKKWILLLWICNGER